MLVSPGDRVEATQVVARTDLPGDFCILPVDRRLNVSASEVEECLQVDLGERVHQGGIVATRGGLLDRSIRSPIDGVVTVRGGGVVVIEAQPTPFELRAHIPGAVSEVSDSQRLVIETPGALIQGMWGWGGESIGVLKLVTNTAHTPLQAQSVDASCHGAIMIGGVTLDQQVVEQAEKVEARGIITGGLAPGLVPLVERLPFPVIVTDGVGEIPMAGPIFDLLRTNEGQEASISGCLEPRWRRRRPEVIIPRPDQVPSDDGDERHGQLVVGMRVRIVRAPYRGVVGKVVGLPGHARRMATGARVPCADVDVGRDDPVSVPLVNLDVLC